MDVQFIKFEPWHLKLFKPGEFYDEPKIDPLVKAYLYRKLYGVTILINSEIAAIIGIVVLWNGVGEVTMIPSDVFYRHLKTGIRECQNFLNLALFTFDLHRIQALTLAECPHHGRFLKALGMRQEGTLYGYGPGAEDMCMYSYLPKGKI